MCAGASFTQKGKAVAVVVRRLDLILLLADAASRATRSGYEPDAPICSRWEREKKRQGQLGAWLGA